MKQLWKCWAKSLGQKASDCDNESDKVAIIRTVIFATYLITNCFIIAGVVRHWKEKPIYVEVEIHEQNYSEKLYTERRNGVGVGGNSGIERVYSAGTIKNRTGEYE